MCAGGVKVGFDRAALGQSATVIAARADLDQGARGGRGLALLVVPPAFDRAALGQSATVILNLPVCVGKGEQCRAKFLECEMKGV